MTAPGNGGYFNASLAVMSGTASESPFPGAGSITSVSLFIMDHTSTQWWNGAAWQGSPVSVSALFVGGSSGTWSFSGGSFPTLTSAHLYWVDSQAGDSSAQFQSPLSTTAFTFNSIPPTSTVTFPTNGMYINTLPAMAGTSGGLVGVSTVSLSIQDLNIGGPNNCYNPPSNNFTTGCPSFFPAQGIPAAWSHSFGVQPWTNGHDYLVVSQAVDFSSNVQNNFPVGQSSNTWTFDTTPPTIFVQSPVPGRNGLAGLATISGTAAASFGATAVAQLRVYNVALAQYWDPGASAFDGIAADSAWFTGGAGPSWSVSSATLSSAFVNGSTYSVIARAIDTAANYSVPYSTSIFVFDGAPPQTGIMGPPNGSFVNNLAGVSGTLQDFPLGNPGVVVSVAVMLQRLSDGFYWTGGSWVGSTATVSANVWISSFTLSPAILPSGPNLTSGVSYYLTSSGTDDSGNVEGFGSPRSSTFTFDNTPPVSAITMPANGSTYGVLAAISGTSGDNVGVSTVSLSVQDLVSGSCYNPPSNNFSAVCPSFFPAQGSTAAWSFPFGLSPLVPGHQYLVVSRAADLAANVQASNPVGVSSNTFTFYPMPMGCGMAVNVLQSGLGDTTTIHGALGLLPQTLAGNECVVIRDTQTYVENVTVAGFVNNGYQVSIMADPSFISSAPVVSPPGGIAFTLNNASITLAGINIVPTSPLSYGVLASSANVTISSVNVMDPFGKITVAGISLSNFSSISNSSVAVQNAYGMMLSGAGNSISLSTAVNNSPGGGSFALYIVGGSYNIISNSYFNDSSWSTVDLTSGAAHNQFLNSTITSNGSDVPYPCDTALIFDNAANNSVLGCTISETGGGMAVYITPLSAGNIITATSLNATIQACSAINISGTSNTVSGSLISNPAGGSTLALMGSYNNLFYSTVTSNSAGNGDTLNMAAAQWDTIVGSYLTNPNGRTAITGGAQNNTIIGSTFVTNTAAYATFSLGPGASSNTLVQDLFINPSGTALWMQGGGTVNSVLQSVVSGDSANPALWINGGSSSTLTLDIFSNPAGYAVQIDAGATENVISLSTITSDSTSYAALYFNGSSTNTISHSFILNPLGTAAELLSDRNNTITHSTITTAGAFPAVLMAGWGDTVDDSYVQGNSLSVSGSTGTVVDGSALWTNAGAGTAFVAQGAFNVTLTTDTFSNVGGGDGMYFAAGNSGTLSLTSDTVVHAAQGVEITTQSPSAIMAISGLNLQTLAAGATGINFDGGTFAVPQTFQNVSFDNSVIVNVNANALTGSTITMAGAGGPREGATYAHDPHAQLVWPPSSVLGCEGGYVTVCPAGCNSTTIGGAMTSIPGTALLGNFCIDIQSNNTYSENLTLQNYNNNNFQIVIGTTTGAFRPTISPLSGATAAFMISNASVTLSNIKIVPTNAMSFGVLASSPNVTLSGVVLLDNSSLLTTAGIALSSFSTISNSSVSVPGADGVDMDGVGNLLTFSTVTSNGGALAVSINGGSFNTITHSSLSNAGGTAVSINNGGYNFIGQTGMFSNSFSNFALLINGSSSNTVTQSFISNPADEALSLLYDDSDVISLSTITSNGTDEAVYINGLADVISQSYIVDLQGDGVWIDVGAAGVVINQSVMLSSSSGNDAIIIYNASSITVTQSLMSNPMGYGAYLEGGGGHMLSQSTFTSNVFGADALDVAGSVSNTFTGIFVSNPAGNAAYLDIGAANNTLSQSTVTSNYIGGYALYFDDSGNTVSQSYIGNPFGIGVYLDDNADSTQIIGSTIAVGALEGVYDNGGDGNTVTQSVITSTGGIAALLTGTHAVLSQDMIVSSGTGVAVFFDAGSNNLVSQSFIRSVGGPAVDMYGDNNDTVSQSTITSPVAGGQAAVEVIGQNDTIDTSYILGSDAVNNTFSTGTTIDGSALWATGVGGVSFYSFGAYNLSVTTSVMSASPTGSGIGLEFLNTGTLSFASNTVTHAGIGLQVLSQPAATVISISTMIFSGLAPGATAINFGAGTFSLPQTFSNVSFDSSVAVNVNASVLSGSIIDMIGYAGPKAGPPFADDPANEVQWLTNVTAAPIAVSPTSLAPSSAPISAANLPVLRLGLAATLGGFLPSFSSLGVSLGGNAPTSNLTVSLWLDTVGDGVFRPGTDSDLSDTTFDSETPPQASFNFSAPSISTTTEYFFVTVSYSSMSLGDQISIVIPGPGNFGISQGFAENQPIYPIQSTPPTIAQILFAKPSAQGYGTPHGGASPSGGFDTGFPVQLGQTILVTATGTWNSGALAGVTNATGTGTLGGLGASLHYGSLVGRIGGGQWFQLGSSVTAVSGQTGDLILAMNDTYYLDNSGSLQVGLQVLVSTTPAIWTGLSGVDNNASTNANWLNGLPPLPGDTVVFDGSLNNNCNWDINNANIGLLEMTTSYSASVTITPAANQLVVTSGVYVNGGVLSLGSGVTLISQVKMRVNYGTFDMGPGGATLLLGSKGIGLDDGAQIRSVGSNQVTIAAVPGGLPYQFKLQQATINFNNPQMTQVTDTSGLVISSTTKVIALKNTAFTNSTYNPNSSVFFNTEASPVSYTFNNLTFDANVSTDVDAGNLPAGSTVTILNAGGPHFGSPFDSDPNHVVTWNPDGGGAPGTITGTISYAGGQSGTITIIAHSGPTGPPGPMTYVFGTNAAGAPSFFLKAINGGPGGAEGGGPGGSTQIGSPTTYTISSLNAPNTYYVYAWIDPSSGPITGFDARGGFGNPNPAQGMVSIPVFVPPGGTASNININLNDWGAVSGTITMNSSQIGPISANVWLGAPNVVGSTLVASIDIPPLGQNGATTYILPAPSAFVQSNAYVELTQANYTAFQPYEASGSSGPIGVPPNVVVANGLLNITGGSAAPGGILTVGTSHPFTAHPGYIGYSFNGALPQPMLRVDLGASVSSVTIIGLRVDLSAPAPPGGLSLGLWRDDNHNGVFDNAFLGGSGPFDGQLNSPYTFVPAGVSSATISLNNPEILLAGTTNTYFVTVDLDEQSLMPPFSVSLATSAYFGLAQGSMANQAVIYTIQTAPAHSQFATLAAVQATGDGNGGVDSGLAVAENLTVQVSTINGTWRINASSTSGGGGIPNTAYLDTVDPEANLGQLIGRIDDGMGGGTYWFPIDTAPFTAGDTGELFLAINNYEGAYGGSSGAVYSTASVTGSTTGAISGTITYAGGLTDTLVISAVPSCEGCTGFNNANSPVITIDVPVTGGTTLYTYILPGLPADQYPGPYYQVQAAIQGAPSQSGGTVNAVFVQDGSTASGVNFAMSLGSGSIAGIMTYTGAQNGSNNYFLGIFDSSFENIGGISTGSTGAYLLTGLPTPATYYIAGYLDVNGDGQPDGAEPFGAVGDPHAKYSLETSSPIFLSNSASVVGKNLTLTDRGDLSGGLTLSGPANGAEIVTLVGHGVFGSPSYVLESQNVVTGVTGSAGESFYFDAPLLNPATDYTLFAFVTTDTVSDALGPGDPTAQDNGPITIPPVGYLEDYLNFSSPNSPPGPVLIFVGLAQSTTQVLWTWSLVPGATGYQLLTSTGGFVAAASAVVSTYTDVVPANTFSAITQIRALNAFGAGPVSSFFSVASLAAVPGTPAIGPVYQSSAVVSWSANGNSPQTIYEVARATVVSGPYSVVFATSALSFTNHGLLPNTPYFWEVLAFNGDGIATAFSATGNATTPAASGASILGTILYPGRQVGALNIQIATSAAFSPFTSVLQLPGVSSQTYYAGLPPNATYFLRAFVDVVGDGNIRGGEDTTVYVSTYVAFGQVTGVALSLSSSSLAPAAPVGLSVATPLGADALSWSAPNVNSNGTTLVDLAGYRVYRSTFAAGPYAQISNGIVLGTTGTVAGASFSDGSPVPNAVNYYRVTAVDYASNESLPASIAATPYLGGSISGGLQYLGATNSGTFRIRLSSTADVSSFIAQTTLSSFSFTGLGDGVYYVEGFRDLNGNGRPDDNEPGGNLGGVADPYPINIFGGSSVTGSTLTICDRTSVTFGQGQQNAYSFTTTTSGCPALDEGANYYTSLFNFRVGGGAYNSLGVGAQINIQMQSAFPNRLILLGPDGSEVAQDNTPGGANLSYQVSRPGLYFIEPTSFNPYDVGPATISLTVNGGYSGAIAGNITYNGAQGGKVVVQLYNNPNVTGFPFFQSTFTMAGNSLSYSVGGLPDGPYYVHAYRDANGNGAQDPGEPTGSFGVSASSLTQVQIQGGVAIIGGSAGAPANFALTDPAVGVVSGQIIRQPASGGQTGTIIVQVQAPQANCANCGPQTVAFATIPAAGTYTVPFVSPGTSYTVLAFVDVNGDGQQDALEAHASNSGITVQANQATTVNLLVSDPGTGASGNSTIQGTISYGGASTGPLLMAFALDQQFTNVPYLLSQASIGSFVKSGIAGGTSYYIAAFLDTNNNGEPDIGQGEPIAFYGSVPNNSFNNMQPIYLPNGGAVTANLTLADAPAGSISGQVSYSGGAPLNQNLVVKAFQVPGGNGPFTSQTAVIGRQAGSTTYNYSLPFLNATTSYAVSAFIDVEGNGQQQPGEPYGQYGQSTCGQNGCFGQPVSVSSGPGTFPAYGINLTVTDPGQNVNVNGTQVLVDVTYLGSESGPIIIRFFTTSTYAGAPLQTVSVPLAPGPGEVSPVVQGLPLGTYYLDAFRDAGGTGVLNLASDAYGVLNPVTLSQQMTTQSDGNNQLYDPGQGGSVNRYSGSFSTATGGARFDGGAVDIGAGIVLDTITAGGPFAYVLGLTDQNQGIVGSMVKYSSAGVFITSATVGDGNSVNAYEIDSLGNLYLSSQTSSSMNGDVGGVLKLDHNLKKLMQVTISSSGNVRDIELYGGNLYLASEGSCGNMIVREHDPNTFVGISTGVFNGFDGANGGYNAGCSASGEALSIDPFGDVYVVATTAINLNFGTPIWALVKFNSSLVYQSYTDITPLIGSGEPGMTLATDSLGNVFLAILPTGSLNANTYKFNSSLQQTASYSYGPVINHFNGGLVNMAISTDNYVYEAWESPVNGGDMLALRLDDNLNLMYQRTFDGLDNHHEDFAFGIAVQDSSNVYLTGGVTNAGNNLDWSTIRLNMNAGGAASSSGTAVAITTSNAVDAIYGTLVYNGVLASSGTVRASLFPLGTLAPIRVSSAPFGANVPYIFNSVPAGLYQVQAYIDENGNFQPDAGEPVGISVSTGFTFNGSSSTVLNVPLCDRRPIAFGQPVTATITPADCPAADENGAYQRLYTFVGARSQYVTIENDGLNFYDAPVRLYDPNMALVASDDGSAGNGNSRITNYVLALNGLYTIAASPYSASITSATIKLSLTGSGGSLGSITGSVSYTGGEGGKIALGLFSTSTFLANPAGASAVQTVELPVPGAFAFANLGTGTTYYLGGFIDVNGSGQPQPGEDIGYFGSSVTGATPIYLRSGQSIAGISFNIAPSTAGLTDVSGVISYSGTQAGTMHVEFWANSAFSGQPATSRLVPTGAGPYDVYMPGGQPYYVRAWLDAAGNSVLGGTDPSGIYAPQNQGAQPVYVPSSGTLSGISFSITDPGQQAGGISGEGLAAILPSTAAAGASVFSATITYTAGTHGVNPGGTIGFTVPQGFPAPVVHFITAKSTSAAVFSAISTSPLSAFLTVNAGASVLPGQQVVFIYTEGPVSCTVSTQTFTVEESSGTGVGPQPLLAGSPSLQVVQGPPASFLASNPQLSLTQGVLSGAQFLFAQDSCGNQTPMPQGMGGTTVALSGQSFNVNTSTYVLDSSVGLSTSVAASTYVAVNVSYAVGQSSAPYYVVALSTGLHNVKAIYSLGALTTAYYGLVVLPNNALTGVSVSTIPYVLGQTQATLMSNGGAASAAYVNFTMGDPAYSWDVIITSIPVKPGAAPSALWETWGSGQPNLGQIAWDGLTSGGANVPNGVYFVHIDIAGGGVHDDSLVVNVAVPQLSGHVYDAGVTPHPPLVGASVQVYGPGGTISAQTDSTGKYVLTGVAAGVYNMFAAAPSFINGSLSLTINAAGTVSTFTALSSAIAGSTNAAGGLDVLMSRAAVLSLTAAPGVNYSTQAFDQSGTLQVNTTGQVAANTQSFSLPLHLAAGTTSFDDGGQVDPSGIIHTIFNFNVAPGTWTAQASMPGFSLSSGTVFVVPGVNSLALTLSPLSSVAGLVSVPANPNGLAISVSAVPLSTGAVSGGGGVNLAPGILSAAYTIGNLTPGLYNLRANTNGLAAVTTGPISVPASSAVTHVDFPAFSLGSSINGTVTFNGAVPSDNLQVSVNAWAPGSVNSASTNVYTTGAAGSAGYTLSGLTAGATYQLYVGLSGNSNKLSLFGTQPLTVVTAAAPATANFTFSASSGVISGTILLPAGSVDFGNVSLQGQTVASINSADVGKQFSIQTSTMLPGFACVPNGGAFANGQCSNGGGSSTATFSVQGLNTETDAITLYYGTTGQSKTVQLSVVNGSTSTLFVDLSPQTFSISGGVVDQVNNPLFNTFAGILANAPNIAPAGYPAALPATTARVTAIRQSISQYNVAISTVFNPLTSSVGFLTAAGTFTINNLPSGAYFVETADLRACATCTVAVPSVGQLVNVAGASVSSITLTLTDGFTVSGQIQLAPGLQDSRVFTLSVTDQRQRVVASTNVYLGDVNLNLTANSVNYSFSNLPAGNFYTLSVVDGLNPQKYVGAPISFPSSALSPNGLQASLSGQNVTMQRAAYIAGLMQDANTGVLITAANAALLAPSFQISATATPWVQGGFSQAASSVAARPIQADGTFLVGPLIPGIPYALNLAQTSWDPSFLSAGSQNYAPVTISGLTPQPGQLLSVGIVSLHEGQSFSGAVYASTTTGAKLANIEVTAQPSFGNTGVTVQTYTNQNGQYTLWVSSAISNEYDITAAPRGGNTASNGTTYGQLTLYSVSLLTAATANFVLNPLLGEVTGQVLVADASIGGQLSYPFGVQQGFPAAAVFMQAQGVVPASNPLGDISAVTDSQGSFSVPGLSTGVYSLRAISQGYAVCYATVSVGTTNFSLFSGNGGASTVTAPSQLLAYTLTATDPGAGAVTLSGNSGITGGIVETNGTFNASGNASVLGTVVARTFALSGHASIGTQKQQNLSLAAPVPDPYAAALAALTVSNSNANIPAGDRPGGVLTLSGNQSLSLPAGNYLLNGISLSGNAVLSLTGAAGIVVTGPVNIGGNGSQINAGGAPGNLVIFAGPGAPVTYSGNGSMAAMIYAPGQTVTFSGNGVLTGNVFAADFALTGNGSLNGAPSCVTGNSITLQKGASVTGRILNSNGAAPNNTEIGGVAAANFAAGEYLVGTVNFDAQAKTVNSYSISGFKPGIVYNLVILPADPNDYTAFPPEGANVSFTAAQAATTQNINLTYAPPPMACQASAVAQGNGSFTISVVCNKDLRNQTTADNNLAQIFQVSTYTSAGLPQVAPNGTGQFNSTNETISSDRHTITAIYAAGASETEFSLHLRAGASETNPQTGTNFTVDQVYDFYTGLPSNVTQTIGNINGGTVALTPSQQDLQQDINEQSRIVIQPGTFAIGSDAAPTGVASATTTVILGLAKALDLTSANALAMKAMGYVPSSYRILGNPSAFPAEVAAAMTKFGVLGSTTNAVGGANPLSAFYTIFLPAGIRHELQQNADVTFSYTTKLASGTALNNINVFYYNVALGQFVIEQNNRRVDTVNQTITVSVNHFSTFIVFDSTPILSVFNPLSPTGLQVINFPNPVDCIVHANIQRNSTLGVPGVIPPFQGTMLRFNLPGPTSLFADATIRVYDLAGELVKTIDQGNLGGEFAYYTPWDCTNNSGRTVASGVYIAVLSWNGQKAFDKIAIIKGSGL
jgi:uncharacterized protein (DUF2141 family)